MAKMKDLKDIMYDLSLRRRDKPTHIGNNCWVGKQDVNGRSLWAQWVRDGLIDQDHIWWAWQNKVETYHNARGELLTRTYRFYLGFFANSGHNKPFFCDLQTPEGKKALKELEKKTVAWLSKKR